MGVCYIVGAGEREGILPSPEKEDMVIACDGGFSWCSEVGLMPDLVIGDFDSLGSMPAHPNVIKLNPIKDETDGGCAIKEGLKRGYQEFVIYGGTGGRSSHTMANIQLLSALAASGCRGKMIGRDSWYQVICNEEVCFEEKMEGYLSVFCLGDRAEGVYEEGLKYTLQDAVLTKEDPVGVSNEFIGKESRVAVKNGMLLLIWEKK